MKSIKRLEFHDFHMILSTQAVLVGQIALLRRLKKET
jgi:hypothetical protein